MLRLIATRVLSLIPTLLATTLIVFFLVNLTPGDPAVEVAGTYGTPQDVIRIRHQLGLDLPLVVRYFDYITNAAHGNLGSSIFVAEPVTTLIGQAFPVTLSISILALLLSLLLGVPAGITAALKPLGWTDRLVSGVTSFIIAIPPFVVGLVLVSAVAIAIPIFPATGYVPPSTDLFSWFSHLVLPAVSLCLAPAAQLARQTRGAFVDALEADYVRTARAKGLSEWVVVMKHASKNAAIPIVTIFGLQFGGILSGAVVVESVFGLPGFGTMSVQAAGDKDFPVIQGAVLLTGFIFVVANLLVDISYGYFNPKVRG